jgi:hypothetical protein
MGSGRSPNGTSLQKRIEALSIPEPNSGCWIWDGTSKNKKGYGGITIDGKPTYAHRASYAAFRGKIDAAECVMHKCDNPHCVNPDHLVVGTFKDNSQDMKAKGRNKNVPKAKGQANGSSKLSELEVLEIMNSSEGPTKLSARYGVCRTTIKNIRRRTAWQHVTA